jgi:hypothetical protein
MILELVIHKVPFGLPMLEATIPLPFAPRWGHLSHPAIIDQVFARAHGAARRTIRNLAGFMASSGPTQLFTLA